MSKHTPGEWELVEHIDANHFTIANNHRWLFVVKQNGEMSTATQEANIRLISKAPEMYELLQEANMVMYNSDRGEEVQEKIDKLRKEIEGEEEEINEQDT